jgi:hypothetical protein
LEHFKVESVDKKLKRYKSNSLRHVIWKKTKDAENNTELLTKWKKCDLEGL